MTVRDDSDHDSVPVRGGGILDRTGESEPKGNKSDGELDRLCAELTTSHSSLLQVRGLTDSSYRRIVTPVPYKLRLGRLMKQQESTIMNRRSVYLNTSEQM